MVDEERNSTNSVERGVAIIRRHVHDLPESPGVYRMLADDDAVLYVGKAKSLKKRVASYTNIGKLSFRLQKMVSQTTRMEFVHTHTEAEALLLESNLIKKLKPRYNILLRDDKSFPYIFIPAAHDYPQVSKHRGSKRKKGQYFGPYASAGDVNRTIDILQRVFLIRNCTDHYFSNRDRPCLQYHIKRCTAPCVGKVSKAEYEEQVDGARAFLEGKSHAVQQKLLKSMQAASDAQDYERAAEYRDRIRVLTSIQARQDINLEGLKSVDVVALVRDHGRVCVQVFFFRGGRNLGNSSYFPRCDADDSVEDIMAAFLAQFYENKPVPREVLVSHAPTDCDLLEQAFIERVDAKVKISKPVRGQRKRVVDFVEKNAVAALERHRFAKEGEMKLLEGVAALFDMDGRPQRIEVYDNSHISGTNMVGAMIVAGEDGFQKNAYRKFNIKQAGQGDDYGMMREVFQRRFRRVLESGGEGDLPDLVLVDGGKGQFGVCKEVLEEFGLLDRLTLVAIAKGEDRHAGREQFFVDGKKPFQLPVRDPVLHYLQVLRDEAHRFAIGSHRARRQRQISSSPLDDIPGVGGKRKKALLHHFGSAKAVASAGISDLESVDGVSKSLARKIYDYFHG